MAQITIHPKVSGLWRVRLFAWVASWLLSGVTFKWRTGQGPWHDIPLQWHVDIDVTEQR